jgi:Dyp-type peroxidase family
MPDGARYDFGRGGSYLVFRQLEQNVKLFWSYMQGAAPELQSMERAAAKMIGRWRNGAPLTLVGEQPLDMTKLAPEAKADFGYVVNDDAAGMRCPIGAHIRRSNPRDALPGLRERNSLSKVDRRRILRRARPYGDPVPGWPDPQAMLDAKDDDEAARGLYFVCLNADIEEQFEFVQQRWLNDPTFVNGYADEVDPVIGRGRGGRFVVPGRVVAQLIDAPANNLKRFVTVRGGEYFFLPSGPALDYLARIAV